MKTEILHFLPVICAAAIYIARILELRAKRNTVAGEIRENLTLRFFIAIGSLTFLCALAEFFIRHTDILQENVVEAVSWSSLIAGLLLAGISFWLRRRAIAALGRFWSLHVE